ncbi:MAG: ABC transporter permease [Acidobacteriota bacterium]
MKKTIRLSFIIFKDIFREKIFWSFLLVAILFIFASLILREMAVGEKGKVYKDLGLVSESFFGVLLIIIVGSNLISREITGKTLYIILSKPIKHYQYILANFNALLLLGLILIFVVSTVDWVFLLINGENWLIPLLKGGYFLFFELVLLSALSLFFSTFMSGYLGMASMIFIYIIGHSTEKAVQLTAQSELITTKVLFKLLYYILPNLENFNVKTQLVYNLDVPKIQFLYSPIYSIFYSAFLLVLSSIILSRKDI